MSWNLLYYCFMICVAHTGFWFAHNAQFTWNFWSDKPIFANVLFGLPALIVFWYAMRWLMLDFGSLWSLRFIAFATSYVVFPPLTWILLNESPFSLKTGICIFLSIIILLVQVLVD